MRVRIDWRQRSRSERVAAAACVLVLATGIGLCIHRRWVSDDIFITFRYCDNLLAGLGPVYNAGERSEGYTHPLWFLLLTLGRALGIEAATLGRWAPIPFFALTLVQLVRLSARLFPRRGGLWGVPVAALGWALLEDAQLFGSGGLETMAFTSCLLAGFEFALLSDRPRRAAFAAWAFAIAWLLRPDGLLYAALAGAALAWRNRATPRVVVEYAAVWLALVLPHFVFRLAYYGYPLPNPYYAKSGGLANWPQGLLYARLYFEAYFVLLAGLGGIAAAAWTLWRARRAAGGPVPETDPRTAFALLWAGVATLLTILYVMRVGGDFMFGRFFLPVTPFLLLLVESLLQRLPRFGSRVAAAALVCGLVLVGARIKHHWLADKRNVAGIVDESQFYPASRLREVRDLSRSLRQCLAGTRASLMVQGGQASLAYYARYPIAIERYGLTDETIAHTPLRARGRPGHEKQVPPDYIYKRGINLRVNYSPVRSAPMYTLFALPGVNAEILVYDRELMDHFKTCGGAQFLDFPRWLALDYIPSIPKQLPQRLLQDWNQFQLFYFQHNPDPEGLRDKLRAALAERGLTNLPEKVAPPGPFLDLGRPTGSP